MNYQLIQKAISLANITHGSHCYNTHHAGHVFGSYYLHDFDLLFTLEGKFHYVIGGKNYISGPGDIIIAPPNVSFQGEALENSYHFFSHFSLSNTANRQLTFQFDDCRVPHRFTMLYQLIDTYIEKFFHNHVYNETYSLALKIMLIEMILCSDKNRLAFLKTNNFDLPTPISMLIDYLETHFKEEITIAQLADIAGITIGTLRKYFTRFMSTTPAKYIEKLKLDYAMEVLSQPNASISLLAEELHYSDQFAFSKAFKRYSSYTPSEYYRSFNVKKQPAERLF